MAYNNNIRTIQNNVVVISGSQIQATGSLFGSNISGTIAQFTSITGSHSGSGAGLFNITASNISNFTNDVRGQFSAGSNITIIGGVISSTGGTAAAGGPDTSVQFNKLSAISGSNLLTYNYTTNVLSGTTAQFTNITGSTLNITNFIVTGDIDNIKNVPYSFPSSQGTSGSVLRNDGSGNLTWSTSGGSSTFGQLTASFSRSVHSVTSFVSDAGVSLSSNIITTIALSSSRDLDEMELAPVVVAVGGITAGVGFNVIAVSLDGDADGTYLINYTRN